MRYAEETASRHTSESEATAIVAMSFLCSECGRSLGEVVMGDPRMCDLVPDTGCTDESLLSLKGTTAVDENTLVYHGLDPVVLEPQDGAWVPVSRSAAEARVSCEVVLQLAGSPFEVAPGLWDTGGLEGLVFL